MRYYAGIGSRKTPNNVCEAMTKLAIKLDSLGYTLRSGGAIGADIAFERGAKSKEIFLPWKGYNGNTSSLHEPSEEAINFSRKLFPHFPGASRGTRLMISRNMHQVLGQQPYISPKSEFIICWTESGKPTGGTRYAIKAAEYLEIPVYNLHNEVEVISLSILLEQIEEEMKYA